MARRHPDLTALTVINDLVDQFRVRLDEVVDVQALWAHGSLAMGDFQLGRSDFDMVALVPTALDPRQRDAVQALHEDLTRRFEHGSKLHCVYLARDRADDAALRHPTWTQGELVDKPLTPVSRRELDLSGRVFDGPAPDHILRPVTGDELSTFSRTDLRDFWYPATAKRRLWLRAIWIDLGSITVVRAARALSEGRLITKAEALDRLPELGAPKPLADDIRARRYGAPGLPLDRPLRAAQARRFVRTTIARILTP